MRTHLVVFQIVFLSLLNPVFSQNPTDSITDSRDGKVYKTVKIGDQWWMAENLAWLTSVSLPSAESITTPYYFVYGQNSRNVAAAKASANYQTYGVLYNWPAALTACPAGWHLPSDAEWGQLEMALGMTQAQADTTGYRGTDQGTQMKTTTGWYDNGNGTNSYGFSALPGGYRGSLGGSYNLIGNISYWWSSTETSPGHAWFRGLFYGYTTVIRNRNFKGLGFSVRCLRN